MIWVLICVVIITILVRRRTWKDVPHLAHGNTGSMTWPVRFFQLIQSLIYSAENPNVAPHAHASDYDIVPMVLTATEQRFAAMLDEVLPVEYSYVVQVAVQRVVHVRRLRTFRRWQDPQWNRISQKSLDFVIIRNSDTAIMLAIELDDPSHERADRIARDELLDAIMHDAGVPLLHVQTRTVYASDEIRRQIMPFLTAP